MDITRQETILLKRIKKPFSSFIHNEVSGGIVLLTCTILALVLANSFLGHAYEEFWHKEFSIGFTNNKISMGLAHWVNDFLMVIFFYVVGLEIKREMLVGELKSPKQAALPILAAFGGMVVPAFIFFLFNQGTDGIAGWGIPMATDIAFAIGVLTLMGKRAPLPLKIFLTALAIVDDLGAVLVIAVFYTSNLHLDALGIAGLILALLFIFNRIGIRSRVPYLLGGLLMWYFFMQSGVHTTIAGVLVAMATPSRTKIDSSCFQKDIHYHLDKFRTWMDPDKNVLTNHRQLEAVQSIELCCKRVMSPAQRNTEKLHPWVTFLILPVFALANAGVALHADNLLADFTSPVAMGVFFGLVIGKPIGITLFSWLAVKSKMAKLPDHTTWKQLMGVACLGGIGFTMSLFVDNLAFPGMHYLEVAKIGILSASLTASAIGLIWLSLVKKKTPVKA
ncbi:MAG: Na+/H+ antiporter NhaA [Bacteroidia bacterium]|jgi:NhaA family Na+:H+ antiporter|nr:Na+/H+ antiporter NhaA [Bacteroidales bacterium]NCD40519.1 Na+/H+ antiporter NhaA [Bacteroidia bacterium]MDD2322014.1 Na+/H+ antiporter NhaA [Bacteroidales bacterium]MDD3009970.1 Na+/H+ antiporter NhaA [Bacteroidales bacterium]MDD3960820.1 Na+/H+ antiporter NhaA [Bacteroidales bacterium]